MNHLLHVCAGLCSTRPSAPSAAEWWTGAILFPAPSAGIRCPGWSRGMSAPRRRGATPACLPCGTGTWPVRRCAGSAFGGGQNHAAVLGTLMAQCLRERWDGPADSITWAPLSARRLRERGYDQAELLARTAGGSAVRPARSPRRCERMPPHPAAQSGLEEESARRANVAEARTELLAWRGRWPGQTGGAGGRRGHHRGYPVPVWPGPAPAGGSGRRVRSPHAGPDPPKMRIPVSAVKMPLQIRFLSHELLMKNTVENHENERP